MQKLFIFLLVITLSACSTVQKQRVVLPNTEVQPSPYFMEKRNDLLLGANFSNDKEEFDRLLAATRLGIHWIRLSPSKWASASSPTEPGTFLIGDSANYQGLIKEDVERLVRVLDWADRLGLKVVLTFLAIPGNNPFQAGGELQARLWASKKYQDQAVAFFYDIATYVGGHRALLALNPLGDPSPEDGAIPFTVGSDDDYRAWSEKVRGTEQDLNQFNARIVKSIRTARARLPIIITSGLHGHPSGFIVLEPIADNDIYYAFRSFLASKHLSSKLPALSAINDMHDVLALKDFIKPVTTWQEKYSMDQSKIVVTEFGADRTAHGAREFLSASHTLFSEHGFLHAFSSFREHSDEYLNYELGTAEKNDAYAQAMLEKIDFDYSALTDTSLLLALGLKRVVFEKPQKGLLLGGNTGEEQVKSALSVLTDSGLFGHGFNALIVDSGWQNDDLSTEGLLVTDALKFKRGIKPLADEMKQRGFKLGLGVPVGTTDRFEKHHGTLGFEEKNANLLNTFNIDLLMFSDGFLDDSRQWDNELLYATFYEWKKHLNKNIITIADTDTHQFWFKDLVNLSRTARRIADEPARSPRFTSNLLDEFSTVVDAARINAKYFLLDSENYANYPGIIDFSHLNAVEQKSYLAMWAIIGAPLLLSTPLNNVSHETLNWLSNETILRIHDDTYEPGRLIVDEGGLLIFRKYLHDGVIAYLFVNVGHKPITKTFSRTELRALKSAHITPTFAKTAVKMQKNGITLSIKPHDCELLLIK